MFKHMETTYLKYILNLRLYYTEEALEKYLTEHGVPFYVNNTLNDMKIDNKTAGGYKVISTVERQDGKMETIKSKFIIGSDGANSAVLKLAGMHRDAVDTDFRWIRVDAVMETYIPDQELVTAGIESPTHGNVFWTKLDHGRSRIGFAVPSDMIAKYGDSMTEEDMKFECKKAMEPFTLEFKQLDWWTLYTVRQGVADSFFAHDCVLLAGDACHVYSSSAAQGMNTGIHDAINLGWKLGGVVKGWYDPSVLHTYQTERRKVAQELIKLDKIFSSLINHKIPTDMVSLSTDPNVVLTETLEKSTLFNIGLGIGFERGIFSRTPKMGMVDAGLRAPDALLYRPGSSFTPVRLLSLTQNWGCFWILVFAGQTIQTQARLRRLREYLDSSDNFAIAAPTGSLKFLTIIAGFEADGNSALGGERFGKMYQDYDSTAHIRYGIPTSAGAIVVVRPDSMLGFATGFEQVSEVEDYFRGFMKGFKQIRAPNGSVNGSANGSAKA